MLFFCGRKFLFLIEVLNNVIFIFSLCVCRKFVLFGNNNNNNINKGYQWQLSWPTKDLLYWQFIDYCCLWNFPNNVGHIESISCVNACVCVPTHVCVCLCMGYKYLILCRPGQYYKSPQKIDLLSIHKTVCNLSHKFHRLCECVCVCLHVRVCVCCFVCLFHIFTLLWTLILIYDHSMAKQQPSFIFGGNCYPLSIIRLNEWMTDWPNDRLPDRPADRPLVLPSSIATKIPS